MAERGSPVACQSFLGLCLPGGGDPKVHQQRAGNEADSRRRQQCREYCRSSWAFGCRGFTCRDLWKRGRVSKQFSLREEEVGCTSLHFHPLRCIQAPSRNPWLVVLPASSFTPAEQALEWEKAFGLAETHNLLQLEDIAWCDTYKSDECPGTSRSLPCHSAFHLTHASAHTPWAQDHGMGMLHLWWVQLETL